MKRGLCLAAALLAVWGLLILAVGRLEGLMVPAVRPVSARAAPLILDAGHGGEDGGAVSVTGAPESRINLEIVQRLRDTLALYGVDPVVLREADVSLHDPEASTLREKKRSDLKNRVRTVEAVEGGTLLSIHQNSYPGSQYRGAQAFYAPTGGSRELAEQVQTALREKLQPDNSRQAKPVPESVYLMNHVSCPAVLVECGFLTNPEEEALLRDGGYQKQLAAVLAGAWLTAERDHSTVQEASQGHP